MKDITVCFIGSEETAKLFGKSATQSDLEFRHYTKGDTVLTFIRPIGYPEKLKPLLQALGMCDFVVIELNNVDKYLAEVILSADLSGKKGLFLVPVANSAMGEQLKNLIKGTSLEHYELRFVRSNDDISQLKQDLSQLNFNYKDELLITLDHAFNVKDVGLVVLGFINGGSVEARQNVILYPGRRDVQVKSIQCMDVDYKSIKAKARVGLALKNCRLEDIDRGSVLVAKPLTEISELTGKLKKIPYYKDEFKVGMQVTVLNGLYATTGEVMEAGETVKLKLIKPIVKIESRSFLLNNQTQGLRLIGALE